jgi:hypothetical protein
LEAAVGLTGLQEPATGQQAEEGMWSTHGKWT